MSEHTPTPWETTNQGYLRPVNGSPMALLKQVTPWREGAWDEDPEAIANAAFIVKAVNSHDALVNALEELISLSAAMDDCNCTSCHLVQQARALLASIKEPA